MAKRTPRPRPPVHPAVPRRDWALAAISVIGFAVAAYLAWTKWSGANALFCTAGSACDAVQASRYSIFLGLPVGVWGAAFYGAVAVLAMVGLSEARWLVVFLLAVAGVSFSGYLTFLELFVIRAVCPYCVTSAVISVVLLGFVVWRRPEPTGRRSPLRGSRLATYGVLVAIVTIVAGAGVYATPTSQSSSYQEALARHLSATGAVMYGAYW